MKPQSTNKEYKQKQKNKIRILQLKKIKKEKRLISIFNLPLSHHLVVDYSKIHDVKVK
jgi:hypothetical protein